MFFTASEAALGLSRVSTLGGAGFSWSQLRSMSVSSRTWPGKEIHYGELTRVENKVISGGRVAPAPPPALRIDLRRFASRLIELLTGTQIGSPRLPAPKPLWQSRARGRRATRGFV